MGSLKTRKTKRRSRDIDQIHADLHSVKHLNQFKNTKAPEDLPGLGKFYCIECSKWFESQPNYDHHLKGKPHKRRVRLLKEEPYSQKEAEAAVGLRTDNGKSSDKSASTEGASTEADQSMSTDTAANPPTA